MDFALGLSISTLLVVTGLCKIIWPLWLIDREGVSENGIPSPEAIRQSRWHGFMMLAFGAVALFAVLTSDGTPPEFIGV